MNPIAAPFRWIYRKATAGMRERIEHLEARLANLEETVRIHSMHVGQLQSGEQSLQGRMQAAEKQSTRLLTLLSQTGAIDFAPHAANDPTRETPLSYPSYDVAQYVYRPAFRRAVEYLQCNEIAGEVFEFGTYRGFTARMIAESLVACNRRSRLYLFDSFEGLPASTDHADEVSYEVRVRQAWAAGAMHLPEGIDEQIRRSIASILGNSQIHVVKGYYENTLEIHLPRGVKAALLHIDCDLYSSTRQVLDKLDEFELLQDGCVVMCDDYNCNRANPRMGERGALLDFTKRKPRWSLSPWFAYGWHGQALLLHDANAG